MPARSLRRDIVETIYDSVVDPSGWQEVVEDVIEASGSLAGGLYIRTRSGLVDVEHMHNVDPHYQKLYSEHFSKQNPLATSAMSVRPGEVFAMSAITRSDDYEASAFFNDWARPQDWFDASGVGIVQSPNASGMLALWRSKRAGLPKPGELAYLRAAAPHLRRAMQIQMMLAASRKTSVSIGELLRDAGFGVLLLDCALHILFANEAAENLMRNRVGLGCESGRVVGLTASTTVALQKAAGGNTKPSAAATVVLAQKDGHRPCHAHLIPLRSERTKSLFDLVRPAVAVFVVDPASATMERSERFGRLFGLTPAEIRVVRELVVGSGLRAASTKLRISEATARTHAQHIFAKTATSRQAELIRLFFESTLVGMSHSR